MTINQFDLSTYNDIFYKLNESRKQLNENQFTKSFNTIKAIEKIDQNKEKIGLITTELARIKFISNLTGINAEPSFCPGKNKDEVLKILDERILLFWQTFKQSCDKGEELKFFREAFYGDPCLNGRFVSLEKFAMKQIGIDPLCVKDETKFDVIAYMFTELMYGVDNNKAPRRGEFEQYLKGQIDYQEKYKKWVESKDWITIFNRAKDFFV